MDVLTFLFGNSDTEGFHCVTKPKEYPMCFTSFQTFKNNCYAAIELYGWHTEKGISVDIDQADITFAYPSDEILEKEYKRIMESN